MLNLYFKATTSHMYTCFINFGPVCLREARLLLPHLSVYTWKLVKLVANRISLNISLAVHSHNI